MGCHPADDAGVAYWEAECSAISQANLTQETEKVASRFTHALSSHLSRRHTKGGIKKRTMVVRFFIIHFARHERVTTVREHIHRQSSEYPLPDR